MKTGVLVKYKDFLPVTPNTPQFSLGEADTPLVRCGELFREIKRTDAEIDQKVYDLYGLTKKGRQIIEASLVSKS